MEETSQMPASVTKRAKRAKLIGSCYFILLAAGNLAGDLYNHSFSWLDVLFLATAFIPIAVNKRFIYLIYGIITGIATLYICFAFVTLDAMARHTDAASLPSIAYVTSYALFLLAFLSSLLLIYAGITISEKRFSFF